MRALATALRFQLIQCFSSLHNPGCIENVSLPLIPDIGRRKAPRSWCHSVSSVVSVSSNLTRPHRSSHHAMQQEERHAGVYSSRMSMPSMTWSCFPVRESLTSTNSEENRRTCGVRCKKELTLIPHRMKSESGGRFTILRDVTRPVHTAIDFVNGIGE